MTSSSGTCQIRVSGAGPTQKRAMQEMRGFQAKASSVWWTAEGGKRVEAIMMG